MSWQRYILNDEGFYVDRVNGDVLAHKEDCEESYEAISELFGVFKEINIE